MIQTIIFDSWIHLEKYVNLPIFTGKPDGNCICIKSLSFAKCVLEIAIKSTMGIICS